MRYARANPSTQQDELWYFVDVAVDSEAPTDLSKAKHVMRNAAGQTVHFPSAEFPSHFRLVTASTPSDAADAYKETLANIRHNSTVRFAVLPFFLTASAVLANAYHAGPWVEDPHAAWFGLGLAIIAIVFEIALSRNLICWWSAIRPLSGADAWLSVKAHRSNWALWPVRYALLVPYLAALYYWASTLWPADRYASFGVALGLVLSLLAWTIGSKPAPFKPS